MSYCQFENTYKALWECMEVLTNEGSLEALEEYLSTTETRYARKLLELCADLAEYVEDEE